MKLTKCDICGAIDSSGFLRFEVPVMSGITSIGLRPYDVCPKCATRIAVFIHKEKSERYGVENND